MSKTVRKRRARGRPRRNTPVGGGTVTVAVRMPAPLARAIDYEAEHYSEARPFDLVPTRSQLIRVAVAEYILRQVEGRERRTS